MTSSPLFSIVIPTRNRAHLLRHALRSALDQNFDDFEIVVVANDCADRTREVVRDLSDPRLRYCETNGPLTMPDNWEFAWTKARGRYVTYLPDDDALVPSALRVAAEHALHGTPPVISWEDAPYYYPDWHDEHMRSVLLLFFHGDVPAEDVPARVFLTQCTRFEFAWSSPLPKLLNCFADRALFEQWRAKLGRLFFPIAPDYSFAWISARVCESIRVIRRPLSVRGISDHSIGSNAGLGAASTTFFQEFGDFDFFADAPLRIPTSLNYLAATFSKADRALIGEGFSRQPLDRPAFIRAVAAQLKDVKHLLPQWSDYVTQLKVFANEFSVAERDEIEALLEATRSSRVDGVEPIRDVRRRTAEMAAEWSGTLIRATSEHLGDELCARCTLGLEPGVLSDARWNYMYLFGDEVAAYDPHGMSKLVDRYYDLLTHCRSNQAAVFDATVRQTRRQ